MSNTSSRAIGISMDLYLLVARVLLVALFPISGWAKFSNIAGTTTMLTNLGAPQPGLAVWVAIIAEILFPALVAIGLFSRLAAFGLVLYTAGTIILAHRFWEYPAAQQFGQQMSFFKNIGLMVALGFIIKLGPGRFALKP